MKKIYSILLVAIVALTGCQQWLEEDPIAKVGTVDPSITTSAVNDYGFTAKISGVDGTSYYSYAVLKGEATAVSAEKLFQKGLGSSIAEGVVNYAEAPSTTIVITDLVPNTKYTVYAIAGNSQSFTGNVVSATVLTSDSLIPEMDKASAEDSLFSITFSEPIVRGEGAVKAYVFARNYSWTEPVDSFELAEEDIVVRENTLSLLTPGVPAGAYVVLAFAEGVVKNMVGTPSEAYSPYEEGWYEEWTDEDFEKYEYYYDVYSHVSNDTWDFAWTDDNAAGDTLIYFAPDEYNQFYVMLKADRTIAASVDEDPYPVRVNYVEGGKVSSIPANYNVYAGTLVYYTLPEPLDVLGTASLAIAGGAFEDVFGNPNAAFVREDAYSCLLVSDGIAGTYKTTYTDAWGSSYSGEVNIYENEDGTYSIYGLSVYFAENGYFGPVVAAVNDNGNLEIAGGQVYEEKYDVSFYAFTLDEAGNLSLKSTAELDVLENGWLEMVDVWGIAADLSAGFWDLVADVPYQFIKISNEPAEREAAPASVKSLDRQPRPLK